MSPAKAYGRLLNNIRMLSKVAGSDVADENFKAHAYTFTLVAVFGSYYIFTAFTIYDLYSDDPGCVMECLCMISTVTQGYVKIFTGIFKTKKIAANRIMLEAIFDEYENRGPKYVEILYKNCRVQRNVLIFIGFSYVLTAGVGCCLPLVFTLFFKQKTLLMSYHLPGIDVHTEVGYWITLNFQFFYTIVGSVGLYAADMFCITYYLSLFTFTDIMRLKIDDFNELVDDEPAEKDVHSAFRDIFMWHMNYIEYMNVCNDIFYCVFAAQVILSAFSIFCTLYVIFARDWPIAYAYIAIPFIGMYIYCGLGTQVDICNAQMTCIIYNIAWYNLRVAQQKMALVMLMRAQRLEPIKIAGMVPVTVNTALQITKGVYSCFTLILQE